MNWANWDWMSLRQALVFLALGLLVIWYTRTAKTVRQIVYAMVAEFSGIAPQELDDDMVLLSIVRDEETRSIMIKQILQRTKANNGGLKITGGGRIGELIQQIESTEPFPY